MLNVMYIPVCGALTRSTLFLIPEPISKIIAGYKHSVPARLLRRIFRGYGLSFGLNVSRYVSSSTTTPRPRKIRLVTPLFLTWVLALALAGTPLAVQNAHAQSLGPNLVPNPTLETTGSSASVPASWSKGGFGTNTRTLSYPVPGDGGGKAVKTEITNYASGDAKWFFTPVSTGGGTYTYEDRYQSDRTSIVTVQFQHSNGSFSWVDIATLPAAGSFTSMSATFTAPSTVTKITVFHLIKGVGFVTVDNVSLRKHSSGGGGGNIFDTGAVTFRLDDGWTSQYQNALPKLNSAGMKATFYIATHRLFEDGFTGYMNQSQLQDIFDDGHEIGAHSKNHVNLLTLNASQQQAQIAGSRQDLINWGYGPVNSFAVPFGAYNNSIITMVQNAGFLNMATSDGQEMNHPSVSKYQLTRFPILNSTTVAQVKVAIDQADANNEWLILMFHEVNTGGRTYAITPAKFNEIVDYVKAKGVPVVTVSQGAVSL